MPKKVWKVGDRPTLTELNELQKKADGYDALKSENDSLKKELEKAKKDK